jgi:hypothetical protein
MLDCSLGYIYNAASDQNMGNMQLCNKDCTTGYRAPNVYALGVSVVLGAVSCSYICAESCTCVVLACRVLLGSS